jgi:hypothetical protein
MPAHSVDAIGPGTQARRVRIGLPGAVAIRVLLQFVSVGIHILKLTLKMKLMLKQK